MSDEEADHARRWLAEEGVTQIGDDVWASTPRTPGGARGLLRDLRPVTSGR